MLKLDPKNTELLSQKQDVLNKSIETTEDKLKQLKEIKAKADEAMANGTQINEENYRSLQREIINTQNKLSNLKNEASNWTKAGDALIKWGENLDKISQKIGSLGNKLTTSLTLPITAIGTAGLTYDAQIEKYETAFKTFLGSAEAAGQAIKNIKDDAKRTPFDTTSLVRANQMLISTGVSADNAREDILALGEAVVATGGGNDELTRMASNLQQIKNAGKATAMDIRQFAYAGIDVYGILADYMGKTTEEIKDMEISYDDLTKALKKASSQGGKYFGAMSNSSETLTGQVSALKSEVQDGVGELTKSLMPVAKKVVAKARDVIKQLDKLSDSEKENIVKIGLMVAAAGPLLKVGSTAISTIGNVSKGIGTFTKAISLAHNGIGDATGSAATLAKVLQGLGSPMGIAATSIAIGAGIIIAEIAKAEAKTKASFGEMGQAASDFYSGIETAEGYLDRFNDTIFASSQEQEELSSQMQEIQEAITRICKTASDERRDYTQEEIIQLDEYFTKLRELEQRELEIEQHKAEAIIQSAKTESEALDISLAEYQERATQWIATAQKQADKQVEIAEKNRIDTIALLNSQYSEEERLYNEEYARKVVQAEADYQQAVNAANKQVGDVSAIYTEGYSERLNIAELFNKEVQVNFQRSNTTIEEENKRHVEALDGLNNQWFLTEKDRQKAIEQENESHKKRQNEIWKSLINNMSEAEQGSLGSWMGMLANTELYGGEISEENQKIVDDILDSYEGLRKGTKEKMEQAMQGMVNGMADKEPTLFAKATGIANGIISRLKKSFDIHSPSKETRDIFQNVMKGAELGLEDEKNKLNKQIDTIANDIKNNFSNMIPNIGTIKQSVVDQTKTIFTTPNITFNVQKMDKANLDMAFDYINRKFGSQY